MKRVTLIFIVLSINLFVFAQENQHVVSLKNGSIIKGQIIELIPNEHVKIETIGGSIFIFTFDEIEKIENEKINNSSLALTEISANSAELLSEYFTQFSIGVAIGGGGILGATYRYFMNEQFGIEGGLFFRPGIYEDYYRDINPIYSLATVAGPLYYIRSSKNLRGKIKKNGISVKVGISPIGDLNEFLGAVNWLHDTYRPENKNRYFSFELGAGFDYRYNMPFDVSGDVAASVFILYWKLNWFFGIE
jgi:hypothetical protein